MSAFYLVQSSAQVKRVTRDQQARKQRRDSESIKSKSSSSNRSEVSSRSIASYNAVNSGTKKYFDESTLLYVYKTIEVPLIEKRIGEYESRKLHLILNECRYYNQLNDNLNRYRFNRDLVFTKDNIRILKQTYYEASNGVTDPIRHSIKSIQFWNNVYQDLKTDTNTFRLLPSITQSMSFYAELLDHALSNVHLLEGNEDGLGTQDRLRIRNYYFYYYLDSEYTHFKQMSTALNKIYHKQLRIKETLVPTTTNSNSRDHDQLTLITTLLDTMIENLGLKKQTALLWSGFLKYIVVEMIVRDNIVRSEPEATGAIKGPRNESISSVSTTNSTMSRNGSVISQDSTNTVHVDDDVPKKHVLTFSKIKKRL